MSCVIYKRCAEIEQGDFRYPSAIAYRHYLNVMELTKQKGRRDGKVTDEIAEAIIWFDKALAINPNGIKDNYRKGNLILDKQVKNFKYSQKKEWTKDTFSELKEMESSAIDCLGRVITRYEDLSSEDDKNRYRNEYVKTLYRLGCYYIEKPISLWNEYACCKMLEIKFNYNILHEDIEHIVKARNTLEKCYQAETDISLESDFDCVQLSQLSNDWAESAIDKLYRLAQVYLEMYFIKKVINKDNKDKTKIESYGNKSEKYFTNAISIGEFTRRNIGFIKEKLAWFYIFSEHYDKAIQHTQQLRDSYAKNTYAIALLLSNLPDKFIKAENALNVAVSDNYNKAKDISTALLAYLYKLKGDEGKLKELISCKKENLSPTSKKLILLLEKCEATL